MPVHCRMRGFDRDLIRGGHYGQRSCEPHLKAEHMAAPTNAANVKKALANSEPTTDAAACPQLAEGDMRALNERSGFQPEQKSCCTNLRSAELGQPLARECN